ncbi:hypothetical protein B0T24DRAFT_151963 [Lasiosphaeria ovina]|uniref:Uncharacterized protein n=1 Tax=Lasiosphaeria ovina TaxID=92902 RepID=A0AAE0KMD8_9PEZI|nr:hypothetical protein B0T24DRAFT_151963 [Lasiosphaeria ovina]
MDITTSSLTTLGSISTPDSFYTAKGFSPPLADTSVLSSPPVDDKLSGGPRYRDATQLPYELKQHCQIHMEEELYSPAIHLLDGFLSDGSTLPPMRGRRPAAETMRPARVAPAPQIALLSTLTIHPRFTSRVVEKHNAHIAAQSFAYLRALLVVPGPVNTKLSAAFAFRPVSSSTGRGGRGGGLHDYSGDSGSGSDSDAIAGRLATVQSLWRRAPDFWSVLGWTFRCAAAYPHRWRHWKVWLEYMIDVLEADLDERVKLDEEQHKQDVGYGREKRCQYPVLQGSLLAVYLGDLRRERKNALREVVRALLAFADDDQAADKVAYKEIFDRETVVADLSRTSKRKRAQAVVDLENNQFGDYLDGESDFDSDSADDEGADGGRLKTARQKKSTQSEAPLRPRTTRRGRIPSSKQSVKAESALLATFRVTDSVAETVPLRLRLFRILSAASYYLPDPFARVDDLYEKFSDRIRALPLPMFRLLIESHSTTLPHYVYVSLLRHIVDRLLPAHHPDPSSVDPDTDAAHGVSVVMLQLCFLPFAANRISAEDNAKLSLVLENMLWYIYVRSAADVVYSDDLRAAVETGIKAREDKIKSSRRGAAAGASKADGAEKAAQDALQRSAKSMRLFVDILAS